MLNIFHFIGRFAFYIQVCILHSVKFVFHSIFAVLCIYVCNLTFKFIFYSSLHFIQVCILFKFVFYSSLHFIQVRILFKFAFYSSLYSIQVCILFKFAFFQLQSNTKVVSWAQVWRCHSDMGTPVVCVSPYSYH